MLPKNRNVAGPHFFPFIKKWTRGNSRGTPDSSIFVPPSGRFLNCSWCVFCLSLERAHSWVAWRWGRLGRWPGGGLGLAGYPGVCSGAMNVEAILYTCFFCKQLCFFLPANREIFMIFFFWSYKFGKLFRSSWSFQILCLDKTSYNRLALKACGS